MAARVEAGLTALHTRGLSAAPWVASCVMDHTGGDTTALIEIMAGLTPAQRSGLSALPDPLPLPRPIARETADRLSDATPAERQVLATAALMINDRVDLLVAASAVEAHVLLGTVVSRELAVRNGTFSFREGRVRAAALQSLDAEDQYRIHRTLFRVARAAGLRDDAAWHALLSGRASAAEYEAGVARLATRLLQAGNADAAARSAARLASAVTGQRRDRAQVLAAGAALAAGYHADAVARSLRAQSGGSAVLHAEAARIAAAAQAFEEGPPHRGGPIDRLSTQIDALRVAAATVTDGTTVDRISEVIALWVTNRGAADARQATLLLSMIETPPTWPWTSTAGPLSPLVNAWLLAQQIWFQLYAGEDEAAFETLSDVVERFPITHTGGGMTHSAARILAARGLSIGTETIIALGRNAPASPIEYAIEGPASTDYAVVAARRGGPSERRRNRADRLRAMLTPRQEEAFSLLLRGYSNMRISQAMGISPRTVEVHLTQVFRHVGARSRGELIARTYGSDPT
ncbi:MULTISPECIES: helix-turn-helix transcriptional regulator [Bacteria]|uniref:helix-turn-helix transcriptional regulator n=1 Tax=Bacteria TaxID=2 RepID=UPI003C7A9815